MSKSQKIWRQSEKSSDFDVRNVNFGWNFLSVTFDVSKKFCQMMETSLLHEILIFLTFDVWPVKSHLTLTFFTSIQSGIFSPSFMTLEKILTDEWNIIFTWKTNWHLTFDVWQVKPVAQIPAWLPANVPQVLINREPLPHMRFDVSLYGDCDVIINHLSHL